METFFQTAGNKFLDIFYGIFHILWGDFITIPLPGGSSLGISLLVLILIPSGIYFTVRTRFLPFRLFPDMIQVVTEKKGNGQKDGISGVQALIVSTATRVGMGNLVGVVAAISAGGAGAVFWMWIIALLGSSTAFAEATLAQLYKEKDPLYGGYRGGPAYYIHYFFKKTRDRSRKSIMACLFALSGLICWCGISQVIGNSVSSAFENAFQIPPLYTTILLVALAAVIVLRKNASVRVLDIMVPVMAVCYLLVTVFIIVTNLGALPGVFQRIFAEAFGFRQAVAGGIGAVIMNGAKRGLFSNEAGSHLGSMGGVFIAIILWLFSFSTFIGILFYARPNIAYLFGDNWISQNLYKILALAMLFVGGLAAYTFVWDLGDFGVGLMTIFNMTALIPMAPQALNALKDYERQKENKKSKRRGKD